jgi:hypothetical protein
MSYLTMYLIVSAVLVLIAIGMFVAFKLYEAEEGLKVFTMLIISAFLWPFAYFIVGLLLLAWVMFLLVLWFVGDTS